MANNYNSNPIYIDTDMASGWRALQTLNVGNMPANAQQVSGAVTRQWGIEVTHLNLVVVGTQAAGTILVADPNDATKLFVIDIAATGVIPHSVEFSNAAKWRDFKITGCTATGVAVQVWYRA